MFVEELYPARPRGASKGDHGWVLVLGGSNRHAGVPVLNARAAFRAGADAVSVVAPRRSADAVAARVPEAMTLPFDEAGGWDEARAILEDVRGDHDAFIVGPGFSRTPHGREIMRVALETVRLPVVVDAAAVAAVSEDPGVLRGRPFLITPNLGEARELSGEEPPPEGEARGEWARRLAADLGGVVLLKGATDYATDGERLHVDRRSTPYMTKSGWGDTVAGVAGALLARQAAGGGAVDALKAAVAASWLVGRAGEHAAYDLGEGLLPSDAIDRIPRLLPRGATPD